MYASTGIRTHTYMLACMHVRMRAYVYILHTDMLHVYTYIRIYVRRIYIQICIYIYRERCIHSISTIESCILCWIYALLEPRVMNLAHMLAVQRFPLLDVGCAKISVAGLLLDPDGCP